MNRIPIAHIDQEHHLKFAIEKFTITNFQNSGIIKRHRHNFYYLLFVKKGTGLHMIDLDSYTIIENIFFFLKPGQIHHINFTSPASGYLIRFSKEFYRLRNVQNNDELIRKLQQRTHYKFSKENFQKLEIILDAISLEYNKKAFNYKQTIKSYLNILFIEIIRYNDSNDSYLKAENLYYQERFDELIEKTETHITSHKKVTDYAEMMNLTTYQLNAICKTIANKTCSQLINEQIILEAKRNLLATSNQINEIAFELGYNDPSYFIRLFKRKTGFSPEAFRKEHK